MELAARLRALTVSALIFFVGPQALTPDTCSLVSSNLFRVLICTSECADPCDQSSDQPEEVSGLVESSEVTHPVRLVVLPESNDYAAAVSAAASTAVRALYDPLIKSFCPRHCHFLRC
jgi:hypothetical protein